MCDLIASSVPHGNGVPQESSDKARSSVLGGILDTQKAHALSLSSAKTEETLQRRLAVLEFFITGCPPQSCGLSFVGLALRDFRPYAPPLRALTESKRT